MKAQIELNSDTNQKANSFFNFSRLKDSVKGLLQHVSFKRRWLLDWHILTDNENTRSVRRTARSFIRLEQAIFMLLLIAAIGYVVYIFLVLGH